MYATAGHDGAGNICNDAVAGFILYCVPDII